MSGGPRNIEDFSTRTEYYDYKLGLARGVLLAYGLVMDGKSYGRIQSWCQEDLNLDDDDLQIAKTESSRSGRFINPGLLASGMCKLTPGALPATQQEQQVIDLVQKTADGLRAVDEFVQADVADLRVPNTSTEMTQHWDEQMALHWRRVAQ